jgi:hypothetical protein
MRVLSVAAAIGCMGATPDPAGGATPAAYKVEAPAVSLHVNDHGAATVRLVAPDGRHWNPEYPAAVRLDPATGVRPDKADFGAADFRDEGAAGSLSIPLLAVAPGPAVLKGTASFSLCEQKKCFVYNAVPIEVRVDVQ